MEDFMKEHDRRYKEFTERDAVAKAAGKLIGRYIRESIADGCAYYVIVDAGPISVIVEHVDYLDGYRVLMIESMDCVIPKKYALENIEMRDKWAEFFDKRAAQERMIDENTGRGSLIRR